MIIELTTNKYSKKRIAQIKFEQAKEFFNDHPDIWYKSDELTMYLGYKGIRLLVNKLRVAGMPIISSTKYGYKLTNNKEEIKKCYTDLRNRLLIALTAARQLKRKF